MSTVPKLLMPVVGILLFLAIWNVVAKNIDTSLGQFPGPAQVWEQTFTLIDEHSAQREKAEAFYARQEERNAARVAKDPTYEPKIRDFTGAPTFFDQIWTSLYTVMVGFFIASIVAVPVGLFAAIYLSDFASARVRAFAKPMLEILAGIPTVVYGFFAAITLAPLLRDGGEAIGIRVASESALAAGIVMGVMIIPFISSLSDDVINSVPQSLRDASLGLGATKAETMQQVVLPAALPGIVSAVLLAVSRAIGETMIVVMAAGQGANLTANPLEAVTTVTVQIVALITGDTEAETAAGPAFTLGFTLFVLTLIMNMAAQRLVAKYREKYD